MDVNDKVCEQVSMTMLSQVYPQEVIERCVQQSEPWSTKARRVRASTALALVVFVMGMALWSRLNQCQVWQKLVGKLSDLPPAEPEDGLSDAGISGRRQALGSQCLQTVMRERCQLIAQPSSMPGAFFGRYRLMAIDGTVFNTPDTPANAAAFGRSSNQYGPGAYPQVRERRAHVLGALEAGVWEQLSHQRRRADGSVLAWVGPTRPGHAHYPVRGGMWVRIIAYRVTDERLGEVGQVYRLVTTLLNPRVAPARELIALYHERWEIELLIDEIKTHERAQRKVFRSKTPEGVRQELYGIYLAHYAVRVLLAQAAVEAELDPDRLSFSEGLFELTETISLALTLEAEEATGPLLERLRHKMARHVLPVRCLRINRREVKQIYNKYKPKKRQMPPPEPFDPEDQFLDFVEVLDPLASALLAGGP